MKCKDCNYLIKGADDKTCFCSYVEGYIPVTMDNDCPLDKYINIQYKCKDCARLDEDFACFTCRPEDSAIHNGHLCGGFIDKRRDDIVDYLLELKFNSEDYEGEVKELFDEVNKAYERMNGRAKKN